MEKLQQQINLLKQSLEKEKNRSNELLARLGESEAKLMGLAIAHARGKGSGLADESLELFAKEQQVIGIEKLVEEFAVKPNRECALHELFELTPSDAYDFCDVIYGGDSQHVRGKHRGA
jgi:hypothetical protein